MKGYIQERELGSMPVNFFQEMFVTNLGLIIRKYFRNNELDTFDFYGYFGSRSSENKWPRSDGESW